MKQYALLALPLALMSCSAPAPEAKSLCQLPKNLAGWAGSHVRWSGIVIMGAHRTVLVAEGCQRRGIPLDWRSARVEKLFEEVEQKSWRASGFIKADISGKITPNRLIVSEVHHLTLMPMSFETKTHHMKSLGF